MLLVVDIPDTTPIDGAVVELYTNTLGHVAADVRIPAPQD
jgi:hypothetical protein